MRQYLERKPHGPDSLRISVRNLSKSFQLGAKKHEVLKNVCFDILNGDRIGLIGENGAGKTTLLNIICGFLQCDSGEVLVEGKINALMSLGIGLKEDLTGRENIFIDGQLHGLSRGVLNSNMDEIVEFTDIGEYIDKPVKTYSSGMKARLAFAMATMIEPEILIIDEVLGVGDANFAQKASKRVEELCAKGKILIVVSHGMQTIRHLTTRTIWLQDGEVQLYDDTAIVIEQYRHYVHKKEEAALLKQFELRKKINSYSSSISIDNFYIMSNKTEKTLLYVDDHMEVVLRLSAVHNIESFDIKLSLSRIDGTLLLENAFSGDNGEMLAIKAGEDMKFVVDFGPIRFSDGIFEVVCEVFDCDNSLMAKEFRIMQIINDKYEYFSKPQYFCDYDIRVI